MIELCHCTKCGYTYGPARHLLSHTNTQACRGAPIETVHVDPENPTTTTDPVRGRQITKTVYYCSACHVTSGTCKSQTEIHVGSRKKCIAKDAKLSEIDVIFDVDPLQDIIPDAETPAERKKPGPAPFDASTLFVGRLPALHTENDQTPYQVRKTRLLESTVYFVTLALDGSRLLRKAPMLDVILNKLENHYDTGPREVHIQFGRLFKFLWGTFAPMELRSFAFKPDAVAEIEPNLDQMYCFEEPGVYTEGVESPTQYRRMIQIVFEFIHEIGFAIEYAHPEYYDRFGGLRRLLTTSETVESHGHLIEVTMEDALTKSPEYVLWNSKKKLKRLPVILKDLYGVLKGTITQLKLKRVPVTQFITKNSDIEKREPEFLKWFEEDYPPNKPNPISNMSDFYNSPDSLESSDPSDPPEPEPEPPNH